MNQKVQMAKLILSTAGLVLREITLTKERIRIGRAQHNEIVIEDPAVSTEHAVIVTHDSDSFLEDLNSTNGTKINGQPVKQHFLRDGDVIELARYQLLYLAKESSYRCLDNYKNATKLGRDPAFLKILSGKNAGRELALEKILTSIGDAGTHAAVIERRADAYYLLDLDCDTVRVNEERAKGKPLQLTHGDVITFGSTQMTFCWA